MAVVYPVGLGSRLFGFVQGCLELGFVLVRQGSLQQGSAVLLDLIDDLVRRRLANQHEEHGRIG